VTWLAFHKLGDPSRAGAALGRAEAARAGRLLGRRKEQYLAGRWLLRELCCMAKGGRPDEWTMNAEGPPVAMHPRRTSPWLSLSHSGEWVVAALAGRPGVGVDLETWGRRRDWTALKRLLDRWGVAPSGPRMAGREAAFLGAWTRYEACYKAQTGPGAQGISAGWTLSSADWLCQAVGPAQEGLRWMSLGQGSALKGWRAPQGPWPAALPKAAGPKRPSRRVGSGRVIAAGR
jgi:hypothetical protein